MFLALLLAMGAAPLSLPADSASGLSAITPSGIGLRPSHLPPPPPDPHSFGTEYRSVIFHGLGGLAMGCAWAAVSSSSQSNDRFWKLMAAGSSAGFVLGCTYGAVTLDSTQERSSSVLVDLAGTTAGGIIGGGLGIAAYHIIGNIELLPPGILFGAPLGALVAQRTWISWRHAPQASVGILPRRLDATLSWSIP